MDDCDKELLNVIQREFPIIPRPYQSLGEICDMSEEEAFKRIERLREEGIIRRLGGVFDSHRLGYHSTLCTAKVPEDKILQFAQILNEIPGVTHNYIRNHSYNIWFTLIVPSPTQISITLDKIRETTGISEVLSLPAKKVFKINVEFSFDVNKKLKNMKQEEKIDKGLGNEAVEKFTVTPKGKALVRALQGNLPQTIRPFHQIAQNINMNEEELLGSIKTMLNAKVMRRLGAVLRHQKAGFTANAMGVWIVPPERMDEVGEIMAQTKEVSHCYERPSFKGWPYNLFTMIHGHSIHECEEIMERLAKITKVTDYSMLLSLKELKKTSMKYFMEEEDI